MTRAHSLPDLIIFDCDGVLVDSEIIGCSALLRELAVLGHDFPLEAAMPVYRGGRMTEMLAHVQERFACVLPDGFETRVRSAAADMFRAELKPIPGIEAALDQISVPICVASNGPRAKIELSLTLTGLLPRFEGRIFSAYDVGHWKPDPTMYLTAARENGVDPARCIVVEDSAPGTRAGIAAGMRVLAYAAETPADELRAVGGEVFFDMADLPRLISAPAPSPTTV
ncbi:HAD-IA family hydrolase [Lacibacterium aquatile]|uniref:HAD-IA family hydrolase n=1 Tax=Lacibacterium aquatile TaxID=1168082 RepID=A0ABW5DWR8_9PROT